MSDASSCRRRGIRAAAAVLALLLGCSDLARGFPDDAGAAADAITSADAGDGHGTQLDAPDGAPRDASDADRGNDDDRPELRDAPTIDRPDAPPADVRDATSSERPDTSGVDVVDASTLDRPDALDVSVRDVLDAPRPDVVDAVAEDRRDVVDAPDVPRPDVVDAPDVPRPDVVDAGVCDPTLGARPVRPLSGSRVTGREVQFRWSLPPGANGARLDFCENRACSPTSRSQTVAGSTIRTGVAGQRWWRVQALQNGAPCGPVSPTWWVRPDARSGPGQPYRVLTDINGDTIGDAFLSGQNAASGAGRLYVYAGAPVTGLPATPTQTLSSPVGGNGQYGTPAAGDFNGDGYTDLAVSRANPTNLYQGQVWFYLSNGAEISAAPSALTPPSPVYSHFGTFMFPGDFNGDGYTDLAVASGMANVGSNDIDDPQGGRVSVYLGAPSGLASVSEQTITSPGGAGSQFGNSGAVVDLDDDGYDDLLVNLYVGSSRVWVHLRGGPSGLQRVTPDINALAGASVSGGGPSNLGDVTGDGRVDVGTVANVSGTWRALVGSGSDGANTLPSQGFTVALSDAPSSGARLMSADMTGDGVSDLLLTQVVNGVARLYLYESRGTAAAYLTHVAPFSGHPDYHGPIAVGDYNGDQLYDVLAGHPSFNSNSGAFSVVIGAPRGFVDDMRGRGVTIMDPTANLGNRIALGAPLPATRRLCPRAGAERAAKPSQRL